jgi:hypothetical protein
MAQACDLTHPSGADAERADSIETDRSIVAPRVVVGTIEVDLAIGAPAGRGAHEPAKLWILKALQTVLTVRIAAAGSHVGRWEGAIARERDNKRNE